MNFEFDNSTPIYTQIIENIKICIISGIFTPGEKLPSVRELASQTKVNPNTMQKALTELEETKLIYTERTNGKFVTDDKKLIEKIKRELAEEKVNNYLNDMQNIGIDYKEALKYLQELGGKQ